MYGINIVQRKEVVRMKKSLKTIALLAVLAVLFCAAGTAWAEAAHERRIRLAAQVLDEMAAQNDAGSLGDVIASGRGVAIFPRVGKAGFIVGGMGGQGIVLLKGKNGKWTGPAFMGIAGASFGLQIGASETALVLVITNEAGVRAFTGGNSLTLGGDVSIAAGPVGRDAKAATDGRAAAAIYSYSMSKGLFAGLALDGSQLNQNRDASKAYWGKPLSAQAALGKPATDKRIKPVVNALNRLVKKAQ